MNLKHLSRETLLDFRSWIIPIRNAVLDNVVLYYFGKRVLRLIDEILDELESEIYLREREEIESR